MNRSRTRRSRIGWTAVALGVLTTSSVHVQEDAEEAEPTEAVAPDESTSALEIGRAYEDPVVIAEQMLQRRLEELDELVESVRARTEELDARTEELDAREQHLLSLAAGIQAEFEREAEERRQRAEERRRRLDEAALAQREHLIKTYAAMEADTAASAIAELYAIDVETTLAILSGLSNRNAGALLDALAARDAGLAARISDDLWDRRQDDALP